MFIKLALLFFNRRKNDNSIFENKNDLKNKSENKKNDKDIIVNFCVNMKNIQKMF